MTDNTAINIVLYGYEAFNIPIESGEKKGYLYTPLKLDVVSQYFIDKKGYSKEESISEANRLREEAKNPLIERLGDEFKPRKRRNG